ncbi:flagellar basal body protein [Massilia forsythiae]|uniref:Flagellar protein FliL n=1 Tax=Massilia forsythiae TaxID=2728020 RepID=A0A7Z2ZRE5_9BURK|nr:flagellar basal body-associated FliL family protein [Massilia forsythiae]QJD99034.1 flagellar basal body protein [Massilia forsythiae]
MSKKKTIIIIAAAVLVSAGAAGGAVWWFMPKPAASADAKDKTAKKEADKPKEGKPSKYVTLDKVIVMLRRDPGAADTHYLSTDLVLATSPKTEKETKENLPLLRSLAVRTLSGYTMSQASAMSVEKFAEELNKSFDANYEHEHQEKPFTEVMIGKLIIE